MTDAGRTDPFTDIISLVAGPIAAVIRSFDQLRRGSEELMRGFENFNNTMANLNETAERINRLLNDFEEPVRAMLPQITRTVKLADELSSRMSVPIDNVVHTGVARATPPPGEVGGQAQGAGQEGSAAQALSQRATNGVLTIVPGNGVPRTSTATAAPSSSVGGTNARAMPWPSTGEKL